MSLGELATSISWAASEWCDIGGDLLWEQVCRGEFLISGVPGPPGYRHAMIRKRAPSTPLSDLERDALERLVRGCRLEQAFDLRVPVGTSASLAARAIRKSGAGSPIGVLRTWSILMSPGCEALQLLSDALVVRTATVPLPEEEELDSRELEVLTLVLAERSSADISMLCGVSPRAVARQLAAIFRKLQVSDRYELAHLAFIGRHPTQHVL
ncbi:MAG: helix-turn-helix transcriptional regulator [Polyangiaceae bacterium]|nr:helix-turn-helix transcriptional regulator [Myxococcales bacterium]MCB9585860.1 helix-turn-helix transcriptional regulator [Polyangiaceae bacterium]MCB9607211.1 helix-turn-helix transcriptional regulator [Polyangiaceae bacterium]